MNDIAFPDESLLAALGIEQLLPAALGPWRPLVTAGMLFFLQHLPAKRQAEIVASQVALPANARPARRLAAFLSLSPSLHKLGQVLARHRHLHPEMRRHLQTLESMPPSVPMAAIRSRLRAEIGADPHLAVAPRALAEGSVAIVVPFRYSEDGKARQGVFKVLKPEIEARLAEELNILDNLAAFLSERGEQLGLPALNYHDYLHSVRDLLSQEIRLETEQANMRLAADLYADEPRLRVPRLLPWCTPRVTAMERVFGRKLTDAKLPPESLQKLADTLIATLLAQPFWSRAENALFHGDLHAGNLLWCEDGRLAVLDWSLAARVPKPQREALVAIALGGLMLDRRKICRAMPALGAFQADDPHLAAIVERSLDRLVLQGGLPGFKWLLELLDELALRGTLAFGADFALFRKSWLSLSGVVGDLAGERSPDLPLLAVGIERFLAETPTRLTAPLHARHFATHVSSADLASLGVSSWITACRYWTRLANNASRNVRGL